MPPQEITGIASSVRPKRRYFIHGNYGRKFEFGNGGECQSHPTRAYPKTAVKTAPEVFSCQIPPAA
jgi:hypothetical protein